MNEELFISFKKWGLSIKQVAEKMGVTTQTLYRTLKGNPTARSLQAIIFAMQEIDGNQYVSTTDSNKTIIKRIINYEQ